MLMENESQRTEKTEEYYGQFLYLNAWEVWAYEKYVAVYKSSITVLHCSS